MQRVMEFKRVEIGNEIENDCGKCYYYLDCEFDGEGRWRKLRRIQFGISKDGVAPGMINWSGEYKFELKAEMWVGKDREKNWERFNKLVKRWHKDSMYGADYWNIIKGKFGI